LIETVKDQILETDENVVLIYSNNQKAYLRDLMDSETKEKVKKVYAKE
jgi:hypothetical protein